MELIRRKLILTIIISGFSVTYFFGQTDVVKSYTDSHHNILKISSMAVGTLILMTVPILANLNSPRSLPFHFYNDNKAFLQVDKFNHAFGTYMISKTWCNGLIDAEVNRGIAMFTGGSVGTGFLIPKELYDGFREDGGFSVGDMIANVVGPAFFLSQELLFNEQIIKYKYSFSRSEYAEKANGYLGKTVLTSYFKDYNGHTYWVSLNVNIICPKMNIPEWVSVAAGYSANGMFGMYENIDYYKGVIIPETQRYRQFLLSPDIDWSKIKVKSNFLKMVLNGINYIKVPFPAIEINSKGVVKGYWLYF